MTDYDYLLFEAQYNVEVRREDLRRRTRILDQTLSIEDATSAEWSTLIKAVDAELFELEAQP